MAVAKPIPEPAQHQLPKVLRFFDVSVLASASMGPAYSLASTMGPVVAAAGAFAPLALTSLSAIMLCIAVSFAMLSRVAPNAGSSYSWIRMEFGRWIGAYGAWLLILSNFFATMAIAVPAGSYTLELVAPQLAQEPHWVAGIGAIWIVSSTVLLYVGLRPTALVTFVALAFEMLVLLAAAVASYVVPHPVVHAAASATGNGAIPITFAGFATAMTLGIWMSDGWEVSASTSEEINDDPRAAGRGGIVGLVITTIVLVFCMQAFLHVGTPKGFADNAADSLEYVSRLLGGGAWRLLIVCAVMVSTLSTLWTTILYLSRSVFAMGRDRVLPRALGKLDGRNEPFWALGAVCVLTTICQLITGYSTSANAQLNTVVTASSVFLGLLFVLSAAATVRRFLGDPSARLKGVVVPALGAAALLAVLVATVHFEDATTQAYAWGGVLLGILFALWRAPKTRGGLRAVPSGARE
ncbi:MAG: APC family permease [Candidatus Eremiobacteraeota bacterium]|nr:APC family permease [Candidatus Eremiobacteraeota bacterium]MBV8723349.1 APC family permease [Candidatus Eremiobacteraeota bacterium]